MRHINMFRSFLSEHLDSRDALTTDVKASTQTKYVRLTVSGPKRPQTKDLMRTRALKCDHTYMTALVKGTKTLSLDS